MAVFARVLRLAAAAALSVPLAHVQTRPPISFEGDVVDASTGKGIAGARVRFEPPGEEPFVVMTDAQGHYLVTGLTGSNYPFEVACPGYVTSRAGGLNPVQVVSRSSASIRFRLVLVHQSVAVGKVIDPVGVPIAGAHVSLMRRFPLLDRSRPAGTVDGDFQYASAGAVQTNDLGEYRIPVPPGTYYVSADPEAVSTAAGTQPPLDPSQRTTFYPHGVKPSEAEPVQAAGGEERRVDIQIVRQGGVKVSGRILGVRGGGSQYLAVRASPLAAYARSWSQDDIKGDHFEAGGLLAGTYRFFAQEGFSGEDGPVAVARRTVEVGSTDLDGVDLELQPTLEVAGSVTFESGCAAAPLSMQIEEQSDRYGYQIHPDAGGVFTLKHVVPGHYKAYVTAGPPSKAAAASVKFGETEGLRDGFDITASETGPLRITVGCAVR